MTGNPYWKRFGKNMDSNQFTYHIISDAKIDIDDIVKYMVSELYNPEAANRFLSDLDEKLENICAMPKIGSIVENELYKRCDVRRIYLRNYEIYYFIDEYQKIINVMRVVSAKRDQRLIIASITQ